MFISLCLKWAEVSQYAPSNIIKRSLKRSLNYAKRLDKRDYSLLAEHLAMYGNHREAESINEKAMALSQSVQQWGEIANYRTMAILAAAVKSRDWDSVAKHMKKSLELTKKTGAVTERVLSLYRFADLMHQKGDVVNARKYHVQGQALADKIGCHFES